MTEQLNLSHDSIFKDGMVENCANSICISRQFEYVGDPSQMRREPTETLSVATGR